MRSSPDQLSSTVRNLTKTGRTKRVTVETRSIQSLDRGLLILETVGNSQTPVGVGYLAEILEIDPSSVFRLANTLKRRGYLANPSSGKEYILGPSIWRLSKKFDWSTMLAAVAHDALKSLARQTNETAHLAIREGRRALLIDHVSTTHMIAISGRTGELMPLYCTSHGKALLADFDEPELNALYRNSPLERLTKRTIVTIAELARACRQIRSVGYAIDNSEFMDGVRCLAAPIRDHEGSVIASIGISAPLVRFPRARDGEFALKVTEIAKQIGDVLGARASAKN